MKEVFNRFTKYNPTTNTTKLAIDNKRKKKRSWTRAQKNDDGDTREY
jgi:hypothetical protein